MRRFISTLITALFFRAFPTMLFCLTLTGATDAVASDGPVVGWGSDYNGQATPPDAVNGVSGTATHIAAGNAHSCAIQAGTGNVVCWGHGSSPPRAVNGYDGTATDISLGYEHGCAIQAGTGIVVCWGYYGWDRYGRETPPDSVNGVSGTATDIAAGEDHSCAIQAGTDIVVCWGYDHNGEATPPRAVNGVSGTATDVVAAFHHSCSIQAGTGNVVCWGSDFYGEAKPPRAVNGVSGTATDISAGGVHSCAIQTGTDNAVCWGRDRDGQAMPPDAVNGVSGTATAIAVGGWHTLAIGAPPRLTKAQQACINAMNKNGEKVNKAQLNESERCLKDFQKSKLVAPMTFDACMAADRRGKMQKARTRTVVQQSRRCASLDAPPPYAYTDSATVNAAAVDGALALTYKIFGGPPVRDADLATMADSKDTARCQLEILKQAGKLENTVLKEVNKAKREALKDKTLDNAVALEGRLRVVFSSNDRISKAQDRLVKGVDRKCADLQAPLDAIFPGECSEGNPILSEVEACVIAAARCEACLKINAFDDLNLICDLADDHVVNGSCL
jgi:hypothetical protein